MRKSMRSAVCRRALSLFVTAAAIFAGSVYPAAAQNKIVFGLPGIPPVFGTVIAYVAQDQGFWKKQGLDVEIRPFDTGTAAARAVVSGNIEISLSPSPLIVNQISNANADIVAIYGMPNPDYLIGSTDKSKTSCADLKGQPVGVDTPGGARSIALRSMLVGCKGPKMEDLQQVGLGTNVDKAMVGGSLTFGVLHLDDVPVIEENGKAVTVITTMKKTNPDSHYLLYVVQRGKLAKNRDTYVKFVAGLIQAADYMKDPKNADHIATVAKPTGRTPAESKASLKKYLDLDFWAIGDDGLEKSKLESVIKVQQRIGGIMAGKTAVTYDRLVDKSVWKDAAAAAKK
jgi:ABC-type nitrate/sulfonate/bicarbonate transport system substrate-binding protein